MESEHVRQEVYQIVVKGHLDSESRGILTVIGRIGLMD